MYSSCLIAGVVFIQNIINMRLNNKAQSIYSQNFGNFDDGLLNDIEWEKVFLPSPIIATSKPQWESH